MSIEKNIMSWLKRTVPDAKRYIQLPYDGDRPKEDYIGFQVSSIIPEEHSYDVVRTLKSTGLIDEQRKFNCTLMVSINAYSYKGYMWLQALHASSEDWGAREVLRADGIDINLVGMSRTQNLSGLGDEKTRPRHQGDFRFYLTVANSFEIYRLSQFIITGRWVKDDILFKHVVPQ
ncbi:MAG: phage neck terminator protein [Shewanella sp.]